MRSDEAVEGMNILTNVRRCMNCSKIHEEDALNHLLVSVVPRESHVHDPLDQVVLCIASENENRVDLHRALNELCKKRTGLSGQSWPNFSIIRLLSSIMGFRMGVARRMFLALLPTMRPTRLEAKTVSISGLIGRGLVIPHLRFQERRKHVDGRPISGDIHGKANG